MKIKYNKLVSFVYETGSLLLCHRHYCHTIFSQLELRTEEGGSALDAGCGGGRLAIALKEELSKRKINAAVSAFDISKKMLEKAEKRALRKKCDISFYQANALNLAYAKEFKKGDTNGKVIAFEENHFDIVTSSGLLEDTPDMEKTLEEMVRVLKPGGQLILSFVNRNLLGKFASKVPLIKFKLVPERYFTGNFDSIEDFKKEKIKSRNVYMKTLKSIYTGKKVK